MYTLKMVLWPRNTMKTVERFAIKFQDEILFFETMVALLFLTGVG